MIRIISALMCLSIAIVFTAYVCCSVVVKHFCNTIG